MLSANEYLLNRGVPSTLLETWRLPDDLKAKVSSWTKEFNRLTPVTIITGRKSAFKGQLAVLLLKIFTNNQKSALYGHIDRYIQAEKSGEELPASFVYAIMDSDQPPKFEMEKVRKFMMNHVYSGKALILEAESWDSLALAYGQGVADFLETVSIEIEVPYIDQRPVKI